VKLTEAIFLVKFQWLDAIRAPRLHFRSGQTFQLGLLKKSLRASAVRAENFNYQAGQSGRKFVSKAGKLLVRFAF
jgi:hypothetical protein